MAINPNNVIIGPIRLELGGVDVGITSQDGIELSFDMDTQKLMTAQATGVVAAGRTSVDTTGTCTLMELSLDQITKFLDSSASPSGGILALKFQHKVTRHAAVLTCPGPNGKTRVIQATVGIIAAGPVQMGTNAYSELPVTLQFFEDPATGTVMTITDGVDGDAAPAVSAWQTLISGTTDTLDDGETGIAVGAAFIVDFDAEIRPDQLTAQQFILKQASGNTQISCTYAFRVVSGTTNFDKIVITPAASLSAATAHELIIPAGLRSLNGVPTTGAVARQFTTA